MKRVLSVILLPLLLIRADIDSFTFSPVRRHREPTAPSFHRSSVLLHPARDSSIASPRWEVADEYSFASNRPSTSFEQSSTFKSGELKYMFRNYINATYQSMTKHPSEVESDNINIVDNQTHSYDSNDSKSSVNKPFNNEISKNMQIASVTHSMANIEVLSQVKQQSAAAAKVEGNVKSSLGSVDVMVPSPAGGGQPAPPDGAPRQGKTDAPMLNYIFDTYSTLNKHTHRNDRFGGPRMESAGSTVSADTGAEAHLDCKVVALQDKLVSWVRWRPEDGSPEILTVGRRTFTADPRFAAELVPPDTWRLVLREARPGDAGDYECQLSTHPPLLGRHRLLVYAPSVELVDAAGAVERDKYYERNSTLALGCRVRHMSSPTVTWHHLDRVLNDDTQRGGVSVKTEESPGGADSTLLVARLVAADSGRYSCSIPGGLQASVTVHVLNESLAELHQGSSAGPRGVSLDAATLLGLAILLPRALRPLAW